MPWKKRMGISIVPLVALAGAFIMIAPTPQEQRQLVTTQADRRNIDAPTQEYRDNTLPSQANENLLPENNATVASENTNTSEQNPAPQEPQSLQPTPGEKNDDVKVPKPEQKPATCLTKSGEPCGTGAKKESCAQQESTYIRGLLQTIGLGHTTKVNC